MLVQEYIDLVKTFDDEYPAVLIVCQVAFLVNVLQNCPKALKNFLLYISGGECEVRSIRVRLDGNSYLRFIIAKANMAFHLTAVKFVSVSHVTMMKV